MSEMLELSRKDIEDFHDAIKQDKGEKLAAVTEFVATNGEAGPETAVEIIEGNNGDFTVRASNGLVLNDLLPKDYKFIQGSAKYFWANGISKTIKVPWDFKNDELSKQQLAHELGHVLDPEFEELSQEISSHWDRVTDSSDGSLVNAVAAVNKTLETELQAHNYGKIVSQALGVDQLRYESRITTQLQEYLLDGLEKLATTVDWEAGGVRNKEITVLDPVSQSEVTLSLGEIETLVINGIK